MHSATAIKSACYVVGCWMICENIAAAILKATGAEVEITDRSAGKWTVSGQPEAVQAALPVMKLAGMTVESVEYDEELAETFAYLTE